MAIMPDPAGRSQIKPFADQAVRRSSRSQIKCSQVLPSTFYDQSKGRFSVSKEQVVLAYSGGLDTSVILGWLMDEGYDVHAVYVDLGQPCEDREAILKKGRDIGARSCRIVDVREELCRDFAFPVLQWQAKYEETYLLRTSIARPLISKVCLQAAREVGARAYAHG